MNGRSKVATGLMWKLLERFGVQGIQFVVQLYLARLLDPAHYGMLSVMVIFTTLANTFIQSGLNTALMQNKDVKENDFSSVFWLTLGIAAGMYAALYAGAPLIEGAFGMEGLASPLRVLALMLFPGALHSVQNARIGRALDFRKAFVSQIAAVLLSGAAGIAMASNGYGVWALVAQSLLNTVVACLVMCFTLRWRPRPVFEVTRVRVQFGFGWKLMASGLLDTLYQDLRSIVIGLKYDDATLGFYNRGKQYPQFLMNAINSAVQSVMLPAMAADQENRARVKQMMRTSIRLSAFIVFPLMAGLAATAPALVRWTLTEKWVPAVPYIQIYCVTMAFYPVHSCNLQAINAMGRSDLFLKLEIVKKLYGLAILAVAAFCFDTPLAIALSGILTTWLGWLVNANPNRNLLGYSYSEQARDFLPQLLLSAAMGAAVYAVNLLRLPDAATLLIQIPLGIALYAGGAVLLRLEAWKQVLALLPGGRKKEEGART